jgi:DNA-binding IclR family transcriptional regulator
VDERSLQLLKVMREQLGETTGRTVDAGAAAKSLGMYPGTLDRSLLYLVRAGYIEEYADRELFPAGGRCNPSSTGPEGHLRGHDTSSVL